MDRPLSSCPIAITDLETTGTEPSFHEIIEIGLLLVDQASLRILDKLEVKVKPKHAERATPQALLLNGYSPAGWMNASALDDALRAYAEKTSGAIFCSHNVTFDWSFFHQAFRNTGVEHKLDYHRLDLFTVAWTVLRGSNISDFNLSKVASYFGLPEEPLPHRAINGAHYAYEVLKRLMAVRLGTYAR